MFAHRPGLRAVSVAPFGLALLLVAGTMVAAMAAPSAEPRPPAPAAKAAPTHLAAAAPAAEAEPACLKPRRKLWIEGEGWVVRRVTVC